MSDPSQDGQAALDPLFSTEGEMACLTGSFPWASSGLGPSHTWPQSLRTAVRIVLTSRFAMWMGWGPELTFFYNDAYRTMTLGAKHPWALGRPAHEVWAEIWQHLEPRITQVMSLGTATWDERLLLFLERSGYREETYHTFSYSPLSDDGGKPVGMLCVVTEDTERVIGERRLGVLHHLATHLSGADGTHQVASGISGCLSQDARDLPFTLTYLLDQQGQPLLEAVTGLAADHPAATGETGGLRSAVGVALLWPLERVLESGRPSVVELSPELNWPAGPWPEAPRQAVVVPIQRAGQGRPWGLFIAGLNRFRPFDDAYQNFVGLFVGQVSAALASAHAYEDERKRAAALAELDRTKTAFFSNVSHEFRTPLTLMLGPTEDAIVTARPLAGRDLETVHRNQLRLLKLVNTLLDFSRIEAGRAKAWYQPVDLALLTSDLASTFRAAVERAGLRFEVQVEPSPGPTFVDAQMWEGILLNLLSNAFKFTFEGGIRVELQPAGRAAVRLRVSDTGVGIPASELHRVFERFHRIEGARARTHEGSGIGLALVQDLVRLHGGQIEVESEPERGTSFSVTIPTGSDHLPTEQLHGSARPHTPAAAAAPFVAEALRWLPAAPGPGSSEPALEPSDADIDAPGTAAQPRILIADDNADMRDYLARLLRPRYQVTRVGDGAKALASVREQRPDLIITDVMMPVLDGFALVQRLRSDAELRSIPIIVLSARAGEDAVVEGIEAGADDYLVKPFSTRELLARVQARLELDRLGREQSQAHQRLEALAHEAASANRAKDEFLAMLGHELRNPLAPMLTALQLLRIRGHASKEQDVLERQVAHLARLVDDLLDVSRITRGKIELNKHRVEVSEVILRAMEVASPVLEHSHHRVELEVPRTGLPIDADLDRMAQVVSNLLTNAAKYSDDHSRIDVRATRSDHKVRISIKDQGIGIAPEMLNGIFDAFVQQPQTLDRARGGLGLGLTIVRSFVEKHGGTVSVESAGRGLGSEFVVELPALDSATQALPSAAGTASEVSLVPSRGKRILLVDDNEDAALILQQALEQLGYQVQVAHDGPSALDASVEFRPDVALLDIGLPVMDGYE
ncbi:MAG TPA: ATP-binding protein, partial [Polyangiaceae bacterium]|nr:ATP-binding protein [Polyangiaceae bacterium]